MNNMTLTQAITILETLLNQQMNDEAEEAIRTVLDGMKQRVEVVRQTELLKQALSLACTELVEFTGSCPYDKYDLDIGCSNCHNQLAECWAKCFTDEADRLFKEGEGENVLFEKRIQRNGR